MCYNHGLESSRRLVARRAGSRSMLLDICNARGQRLRSLGRFGAGQHHQAWDGTDDRGQRLASGVYFVRLGSPSRSQTRKILMVQ
jgi:hypothetical protein